MTREELEKEAEEYADENDICVCDEEYWAHSDIKQAYLAGAEPREKRINKLEAQIEKMKCCGNCAKRGHICVAEEMQGKLCGKNKDKWELRR